MNDTALAQLKKTTIWGTYGKSGKEPLKWVRLIDCSTEHLEAILRNCPVPERYCAIIKSILEDRK